VNALMPGLILGEQGTRIRDRFDRLELQEQAMLARYPTGSRAARRCRRSGRLCFLNRPASFRVALPVDGAYR
jgi:hypothetical protein